MKRVLMGLSVAVTLLWVLGVVIVSVKQYVDHRGLLDQLLETATFALVPAATLWGFLYTGFWVTRGSAGQTDIFGISMLTGIGVFFLAFGYLHFFIFTSPNQGGYDGLEAFALFFVFETQGGLDGFWLRLEAFGLSLSMAFGLGCLVAAFLSYRHRDEQ